MLLRLFKCVARAAVANVGKALLDNLPFGNAAYDFATDMVKYWKNDAPKAEDRRIDLRDAAIVPLAQAHHQAAQAVAEVAADQPEPIRCALTAMLTQLPGTIRRSLSRPDDMTGTTVPAERALDTPEDVLPFLPARPPHPGLHAGRRIGDWELVERVGAGGFGKVWKAVNPHLPPAAFKFCTDAAAAKALLGDAVLLGRVCRSGRHPGIVALEDTSLSHDPPFIRCEYVAGGDLTALIPEWARVEPPLRLMHELATAVGFAHRQGIVHRDLKPANILLQPCRDGAPRAADRFPFDLRVADFGIGGITSAQALVQTRLGTTPGEFLTTALRGSCTPIYASPHQRHGGEPDARDDVYSLGVIWYQLLRADLLAEITADWRDHLVPCAAPNGILNLLARCLAAKPARPDLPDRRLADGNGLADELVKLDARRREGKALLVQRFREILDRTQGKLAKEDMVSLGKLCKENDITTVEGNAMIAQERKRWVAEPQRGLTQGTKTGPNDGGKTEEEDPPPEPAFPLVESFEQVEENMHRLEAYLRSANEEEKQFAKDLFYRPKCIVLISREGRILAGPSRFVGYAASTCESFFANEGKDGKETNWAITNILGTAPVADPALEEKYQEFCRRHQIEKVSRVARKYWNIG